MSEPMALLLGFGGLMLFALTLSGGLHFILTIFGPKGSNQLERSEGLRLLRRTMKDIYGPEVAEDDEAADAMARQAWATYRHVERMTDYRRMLRS